MPKNVGDLGKLIVAKGFKNCPISNKSSKLVTLQWLSKARIKPIAFKYNEYTLVSN